jgi:PAS domain S-box-containing protein
LPDLLIAPPHVTELAETDSATHLVRILEKQPVCLARFSIDGTFLAANEKALAFLGAERLEQVLDTSLLDVVAPSDRSQCETFLKSVAGGKPKSLEVEISRLDGSARVVELHAVPHPSPALGVMSALCSFHDVSRHRHLEQAVLDATRQHEEQVARHARETAALQGELAELQQLVHDRADDHARKRTDVEQRLEESRQHLEAAAADHLERIAQLELGQRRAEEAVERSLGERDRLQVAVASYQVQLAQLEERLHNSDEAAEQQVRRAEQQARRQEELDTELAAARQQRDETIADLTNVAQLDKAAFEARVTAQQAEIDVLADRLRGAEADGDSLRAETSVLMAERTALLGQLDRQARLVEVGRLSSSIAADIAAPLTTIASRGRTLLASLDVPQRPLLEQMLAAGFEAAVLIRPLMLGPRVGAVRAVNVADVVTAIEPTLRAVVGPDVSFGVLPGSRHVHVQIAAEHLEQQLLTIIAVSRAAIGGSGQISIEFAEVEIDDRLGRERAVPAGRYVLLAVHVSGSEVEERLPAQLFDAPATKEAWRSAGPGMLAAAQVVADAGGHLWASREATNVVALEMYLPQVTPAAIGDVTQPEGN